MLAAAYFEKRPQRGESEDIRQRKFRELMLLFKDKSCSIVSKWESGRSASTRELGIPSAQPHTSLKPAD